jgi:hypothetical protein
LPRICTPAAQQGPANHVGSRAASPNFSSLLDEFAQREVLREEHGTYQFVLPLFEAWLVDAGVTKLIPEQSAQEQAALSRRAEDEAFVTPSETTKLASTWPSYRGQAVGPERIRDWLNQVGSNQEQRILFKLLQNMRFVSEQEIREKLRLAQSMVRMQTSGRTPTSRAERRFDLVITYVDGEGKSGQYYASKYAEENRISTQCVIGQTDFTSRLEELENQRGPVAGIVIVDDVVATGKSLSENIKTFLVANPSIIDRGIPVIAVVLFSTVEGEQQFRDEMTSKMGQNVDLRVCEHIDKRMLPFSAGSALWGSEVEAERASSLVRALGSQIYKNNPFGYGDLGLLLVFPHSVPNNSLPILHSAAKGPRSWEPLFQRPVN